MEERAYEQTHRIEERHWWFRGMRAVYRGQLEDAGVGPGAEILDVGCGTGGNRPLLESFGRVTGMDLSRSALRFARERGWRRTVLGSSTEIPFPDAGFDLVTAFGVIEHVDDDRRMLEELLRVTRPGGHLLLMTSAHPWLWSVHDDAVHHLRRYRKRELGDRVRDAGWRVEQLSYVNAALFAPIAAVRLGQRLVPSRPEAEGMSGFFVPPAPLNRALEGLLALEGRLMRSVDLPFGVGFIVRARREGRGSRA